MQKAHDASKNDFWRNKPDTSSPITQNELNRMETTMDVEDDRIIVLDTTKANQSDLLLAVKTIAFSKSTGVFTFTFFNGTVQNIDTDLEKIAINFDYDDDPTSPHYQCLVLELDDGTYKYIDLSALITQYEFDDTATIGFTVGNSGRISAIVKDGSITEAKLQPNYLAEIKVESAKAEAAAAAAEDSAEDAEAWAVGKRNDVPVPSTDPTYENNSKYWAEQAREAATGGHIIVNENGQSMTKRSKLKFAGGAVTTDDQQNDTTLVTIEGGGHKILNQNGTELTERKKLQFLDATPTDDSTNAKTTVEVVRQVASEAVVKDANTPDGLYQTPEEDDYIDGVTRLQTLDMVGKTYTFNADGSISCVAEDYTEEITFNADGSISDAVTIGNKTTTKTTTFVNNTIVETIT